MNGTSCKTGLKPETIDLLMQHMERVNTVEIKVCQPHIFECKVDKRSQSMGLELNYCHSGTSLIIAGISGGGTEGLPQALLQAIQDASDHMTLKCSRIPI